MTHKSFWTRYFFKVHLIELQEAKRQALRKRADMASRIDSDPGMNWDDVGDLAGNGKEGGEEEIPAEVQDKLLSDYERELITEKMKKGEKQGKKSEVS